MIFKKNLLIIIIATMLMQGCASIDLRRDFKPVYPNMSIYDDLYLWTSRCSGTGSMRPFLHAGSTYRLVKIPFDDIVSGMVAVYRYKQGTIIHMTYQYDSWSETWMMYGINNDAVDWGKGLSRDNYVGVMVGPPTHRQSGG